jgi:hypothetical protein
MVLDSEQVQESESEGANLVGLGRGKAVHHK